MKKYFLLAIALLSFNLHAANSPLGSNDIVFKGLTPSDVYVGSEGALNVEFTNSISKPRTLVGPGDIVFKNLKPSNVYTGPEGALNVEFTLPLPPLPPVLPPACDTTVQAFIDNSSILIVVECNAALTNINLSRNGVSLRNLAIPQGQQPVTKVYFQEYLPQGVSLVSYSATGNNGAIPQGRAVYIMFPTTQTFTVTGVASPAEGGTINCSPSNVTGTSSTSICAITTNSGYTFVDATSTCGGGMAGNNFITGAISNNCTVTANFSVIVGNNFSVQGVANPLNGGTVTCTPSIVALNSTSSCIIVSAAGFSFNGATSTCGGFLQIFGAPTTFNTGLVTSNCVVTADFVAARGF